jgi:hypothetical protein
MTHVNPGTDCTINPVIINDTHRGTPSRRPTYKELARFAKWTQMFQPDALRIMRENHLVLDNLNDPMQKLAFTFYTNLVEIAQKSEGLFEGEL